MAAPTFPHSTPGFLLVASRAFFRHKRLFLATFLISMGLVAVYTGLTKRQYRSEMKFIVRSARSNGVLSPDNSTNSVLQSVSEEQLNSELAIIQSEDVIGKVADPTWDARSTRSKSSEELKEHANRLASFTKHLTVDPVGKADIMTLSYLAPSAVDARDALTRLAAAYLAQHQRLQRPAGTSSFYDAETARYEGEWKAAVQQFVAFQQAHALVSVSDEEQKLQKAIADDEESLRINQVKLDENVASMDKVGRLLSEVPGRQQTQERSSPSELLIQQLKVQLMGMENHRTELLTKFMPTDRSVTEVDTQIQDTKAAIEKASSEKNVEDTTDINPPWQHLVDSAVAGKVEYQSLSGAHASLSRELASLKARLAQVQSFSGQFDQLRSKSEQAESNFEAFVEKRDRAHIEDAMDASRLLNVGIMENPTLPYSPAQPKVLLNFLLGVPTALFLSLAVLYFVEAGRTTFGTPAELEAELQCPVIATIPLEASPRAKSRRPTQVATTTLVAAPEAH